MASGVALRESVKEMKRLKNEPLLMLAIIAIYFFVGFFVVYPVIRVITFPSGQDYMQLFQKARWFTALKNSLFMTLISTVSCTAVAFLFAYVIARLDVPCKGLFRFVTLLPIVSPPFIVALSYIRFSAYRVSSPNSFWGCMLIFMVAWACGSSRPSRFSRMPILSFTA